MDILKLFCFHLLLTLITSDNSEDISVSFFNSTTQEELFLVKNGQTQKKFANSENPLKNDTTTFLDFLEFPENNKKTIKIKSKEINANTTFFIFFHSENGRSYPSLDKNSYVAFKMESEIKFIELEYNCKTSENGWGRIFFMITIENEENHKRKNIYGSYIKFCTLINATFIDYSLLVLVFFSIAIIYFGVKQSFVILSISKKIMIDVSYKHIIFMFFCHFLDFKINYLYQNKYFSKIFIIFAFVSILIVFSENVIFLFGWYFKMAIFQINYYGKITISETISVAIVVKIIWEFYYNQNSWIFQNIISILIIFAILKIIKVFH